MEKSDIADKKKLTTLVCAIFYILNKLKSILLSFIYNKKNQNTGYK